MNALKRVSSLAPSLRMLIVQRPAIAAASQRGMTNFKDKERGEETVHFRKEDEKLLRKLLEKVRAQADKVDTKEAEDHAEAEFTSLKKIVGKYNMSDADLKALVNWKHEV